MDRQVEAIMRCFLEALEQEGAGPKPSGGTAIPVGVSNRHAHLSRQDLDTLFGPAYELTALKDLSQPGQTACRETVTIVGPKGAIERVRILGPVRRHTQVEILAGDRFKLGVSGALRLSDDLEGTPGVTIVGPRGSVQLREGLIVARRHIHMLPQEALRFGVRDGDAVDIQINGPRGGVLSNVIIRARQASALECHVDTEEATALGLTDQDTITILK